MSTVRVNKIISETYLVSISAPLNFRLLFLDVHDSRMQAPPSGKVGQRSPEVRTESNITPVRVFSDTFSR